MLTIILSVLAVVAIAWALAYHRANALAWSVVLAAGLKAPLGDAKKLELVSGD